MTQEEFAAKFEESWDKLEPIVRAHFPTEKDPVALMSVLLVLAGRVVVTMAGWPLDDELVWKLVEPVLDLWGEKTGLSLGQVAPSRFPPKPSEN